MTARDIQARLLVDRYKRSLCIPNYTPARWWECDVFEVTVDKIEPYGLFVSFAGGRGLVPNVEMGTPFGTDHRKQFPAGTKFKALLSEIDTQGRLRLSKVGAEQAEDRAEVRKYLSESQPKTTGKGFGTFADLLKAKQAPK